MNVVRQTVKTAITTPKQTAQRIVLMHAMGRRPTIQPRFNDFHGNDTTNFLEDADTLIRFGVKRTEVTTLMILSCLFSAYHALKADIRAGRINMHASGWIKNAWSVYANAIKAEAGELRLDSRAFSLLKFNDFSIVNRTYCPLALGGMSNPAENTVAHDPH